MAVFAVVCSIRRVVFGQTTNIEQVKITPIAVANIGWRIFVVFAVLNAAFIPMVYCFYPETKGLELEDIPLLFPKKSITGGVFTSRGKTVVPRQHARQASMGGKEKEDLQEIEMG